MIDVIIPAYNAHDSILKCLASIYFQTISDLVNVYIIDDCSKKPYDEVIEPFKDLLNIKLIRLEKNSGPGVARQVGLDNSNGRYVIFLDSDDCFFNCYSLLNMYNGAADRDDVLVYGYTIIEGKDDSFRRLNNEGSLHAKLFCRKVIDEYDLKFYPGYNHEDLSFYLLYYSANVDKIYIDGDVYLYKYNEKSITNTNEKTYELEKSGKYVDNIIWYVENCEKRNFDELEIASNIYYAFVILYNIYNGNYENNCDVLFDNSKKLYDVYEKYEDLLTEDLKIELYNSTGRDFIPVISFYDFLDKIANV